MWLLRVQRLGPVLIQGRCSPPAYTGCEVVRGQGGAQVAALGTPDLLPGSWVPLLPIPGRHRRQRGRPALEGRVSGGSRTFSGGWCLLSSEPAPPLRNLRWCQVPVAIVSTDLHDWRAWTGRAQVTGAPQLHLEEPRPPRILLLKQQSGSEWSGCWGGVCVWGGRWLLRGPPAAALVRARQLLVSRGGVSSPFPGKKTEAEGGWLQGRSWDFSLHFTLLSRPCGCTGFA